MNRDTTNSILTGALVVSLIASVVFCLQFTFRSRELRQLGMEVNSIQMARAKMQQLVGACMEYAKTNAALDPILEPVGLNPKAARAAAAKPAGK